VVQREGMKFCILLEMDLQRTPCLLKQQKHAPKKQRRNFYTYIFQSQPEHYPARSSHYNQNCLIEQSCSLKRSVVFCFPSFLISSDFLKGVPLLLSFAFFFPLILFMLQR
jgi:hypothetical protein